MFNSPDITKNPPAVLARGFRWDSILFFTGAVGIAITTRLSVRSVGLQGLGYAIAFALAMAGAATLVLAWRAKRLR